LDGFDDRRCLDALVIDCLLIVLKNYHPVCPLQPSRLSLSGWYGLFMSELSSENREQLFFVSRLVLLFLAIYFLVLFLFMGFFDLPDYSSSAAGFGAIITPFMIAPRFKHLSFGESR
jgi:hypothetical protein